MTETERTTGDELSPAVAAAAYRSLNLRLLSLLLVFLIVIPARLVFKPLGAAGTPAEILCVLLLCTWVFNRISSPFRRPPLQPVQYAMLFFIAAIIASYIVATTRPITGVELSGSDRAVLNSFGWLGVLFFAAELPTRADLDRLFRRLSFGAGALATRGIAQFLTGMPFTNYIVIPGLTLNSQLQAILGREGRNRPSGTATHPIEFGAVLTMVLPIAIHYALFDTHRSRLRRWYPVMAISAAIPISISRSAVVSASIALILLIPSWPTELRRKAYVAILGLFGVAYMFVPGLIGTLTGLFTNLSNDDSAHSRTGSYQMAFDFIGHDPFFGRGFGTFLPAYRILDDQYLGISIELGLVGLAAILTLFITAIVTNLRLRRRSTDPATRNLAQSLAAAFAATTLSSALYDSFAFPMATTLVFFVLGCCAALQRTAHDEQSEPATIADRNPVTG